MLLFWNTETEAIESRVDLREQDKPCIEFWPYWVSHAFRTSKWRSQIWRAAIQRRGLNMEIFRGLQHWILSKDHCPAQILDHYCLFLLTLCYCGSKLQMQTTPSRSRRAQNITISFIACSLMREQRSKKKWGSRTFCLSHQVQKHVPVSISEVRGSLPSHLTTFSAPTHHLRCPCSSPVSGTDSGRLGELPFSDIILQEKNPLFSWWYAA